MGQGAAPDTSGIHRDIRLGIDGPTSGARWLYTTLLGSPATIANESPATTSAAKVAGMRSAAVDGQTEWEDYLEAELPGIWTWLQGDAAALAARPGATWTAADVLACRRACDAAP